MNSNCGKMMTRNINKNHESNETERKGWTIFCLSTKNSPFKACATRKLKFSVHTNNMLFVTIYFSIIL